MRRLRQTPAVDYGESDGEDGLPHAAIPFAQLARALMEGSFPQLAPQPSTKAVTPAALRESGFRAPLLVRCGDCVHATRQALGLRVPQGLGAPAVAAALGLDTLVHTLDVATQRPGLRMTLGEWARYFELPPHERRPLLNVVALNLGGTPLEAEVHAPAAVRGIDLASIWPPGDLSAPQVQLYCLMSPAGSYTDWHVDMAGSAVWYHLLSGRKVFLLAPPTPANLAAYEAWAGSERQAEEGFARRASGCLGARGSRN
ncbi:hypothetical protein WJX81_001843 [Elliptochloris bilobata]|uniref:JmjC domain-containing protein n=2 Tax=Elliptochloris bilobata TaxID=381761 RepID=A0AAW1QJ07_9CHLO